MMVGVNAFERNPTLQVLCNSFTDNSSVINVNYAVSGGFPVAPMQGRCSEAEYHTPETGPAGNIFDSSAAQQIQHSLPSPSSFTIIYNHASGSAPSPTIGDVSLNGCSSGISSTDCGAYTNTDPKLDNDDDDDGGGGGSCCPLAYMRSHIIETEEEIQEAMNLLTQYNRLDYSGVINASSNIDKIMNKIEGFKIFLSNNELKAVTSKLSEATASDVLALLKENTPLDNEVLQALSDQVNTLSFKDRFLLLRNFENEIGYLYENIEGISPRQIKVLEVHQMGLDQKWVDHGVIQVDCCRSDSQAFLNELQYAAKNSSLNKTFFQKQIVEYALEYNNTRLANNTLNAIDTANDEDLTDYVALQKFKAGMQIFGKTLHDLNENDITALEKIANNNTIAGIAARNAILSIRDSLAVIQIPLTTLQKSKKVLKPLNPLPRLKTLKEKPVIYPNPAKDLLYLNIANLPILSDLLKIKIYNNNGILVHQIDQKADFLTEINISQLVQGAYFVEILDENNGLIDRSKIVLIK